MREVQGEVRDFQVRRTACAVLTAKGDMTSSGHLRLLLLGRQRP